MKLFPFGLWGMLVVFSLLAGQVATSSQQAPERRQLDVENISSIFKKNGGLKV